MKEYRVLNLGAGVQSTTLYLMFARGEITPPIDYAIFADTGEEPGAVYKHLEWLQSLDGPPILVRSVGKLGDDLMHGSRAPGRRFAAIPAFTKEIGGGGDVGRIPRQCSSEYKIEVIERAIRRDVVGLAFRQRIPKDTRIFQYFGISMDEAGRAVRIQVNMRKSVKWSTPIFPLVDRFWTRTDCIRYLADKVPHETPRSACVFCPFHTDAEWYRIKHEDPEGWARAVDIDHGLRTNGVAANRGMRQELFVHRSCQPLELVQLDTRPTAREAQLSLGFAAECMGVCGV